MKRADSQSMLTFRRSVREDAPLIQSLINELAEYEKLKHEALATVADIERDLFCESPRVFADIAEWDGSTAGFALWYYNYSTFQGRHGIYLEDLFVRQEFRGKGIGKALILMLARSCAEEGLTRLQWQVLDWNTSAIAFYESLGAREVEHWRTMRVSGGALRRLAEMA
jgi:GNAT superfamily N-acetyltransferase